MSQIPLFSGLSPLHPTRGRYGPAPIAREAVLALIREKRSIDLPALAAIRDRCPSTLRSQIRALVALGLVKISSQRPTIVEVHNAT